MPRRPLATPASLPIAAPAPGIPYSDVIFDVEIDRGALHFVLANIGSMPAHAVRVKLDRPVRDLADQQVDHNPLYTRLEFLGPGRRVRLLVDVLSEYERRRQPMKFGVALQWTDDTGHTRKRTLVHDLTAWTQLREAL